MAKKSKSILTLLTCVAALGLGPRAIAAGLSIELPPETAGFKPGPGVEIANGLCLTCHSADYVSTQPPPLKASRSYWKATIEKMKNKMGASIPDDQVDPLIEYLVNTYGASNSSVSMAQEQKAEVPASHHHDLRRTP